jgi:hypothetical protein
MRTTNDTSFEPSALYPNGAVRYSSTADTDTDTAHVRSDKVTVSSDSNARCLAGCTRSPEAAPAAGDSRRRGLRAAPWRIQQLAVCRAYRCSWLLCSWYSQQ